jgi:hypothetical protein
MGNSIRTMIVTLGIAVAGGCATGSAGVDPGSRDWGLSGVASEVEIVVSNEWTTVARVALVAGGAEIPLGRVEARQERSFRLPASSPAGSVQLVAHPNAVWSNSSGYLSEPFSRNDGDLVMWTLRDRPATSSYEHSMSAVRVVPCGGGC